MGRIAGENALAALTDYVPAEIDVMGANKHTTLEMRASNTPHIVQPATLV